MGILSIMFCIFDSLIVVGMGYLCKSAANVGGGGYIGYRTKLSRKNDDTWKEANTYGGKVFILCGLLCLVISTTFSILFYNQVEIAMEVPSITMLIVIFIGIYVSEKHLKNTFDSEGNRK